MLAIIDEAGRKFNANETDGVSRRHKAQWIGMKPWAARVRLPVIPQHAELTEAGGLMAYGPNIPDIARSGLGVAGGLEVRVEQVAQGIADEVYPEDRDEDRQGRGRSPATSCLTTERFA
jgi:hypothetical protein